VVVLVGLNPDMMTLPSGEFCNCNPSGLVNVISKVSITSDAEICSRDLLNRMTTSDLLDMILRDDNADLTPSKVVLGHNCYVSKGEWLLVLIVFF
jgi:hypothetical protein